MDDNNCPLPYVDFNKFCEYQTDLLLKETDTFFKQHNLRLRKYVLPVKLPEWAKSFSDVLDRGQEYEPLTTIYRHKHFLKCRILHNYSYIETKWNRSNDVRNKNIPFDLRPLTSEILNQLDIINEDMLDPEFSGLLVTLNTNTYGEINNGNESENNSLTNFMNGIKSNELNGTYEFNLGFQFKSEETEGLLNGFIHNNINDQNELINNTNNNFNGNTNVNQSTGPGYKNSSTNNNGGVINKNRINGDCVYKENKHYDNNVNGNERDSKNTDKRKISKIIAGALVECLVTNERCIKSIWLHPDLSKHSSRIVLQSFLPRLMYEIFLLPSVITDKGVSRYNKFTYIMHNDLDLFPRQCWLLLASNKKMSLPRHYEPSTFEEHPVQLEYGDCHTDEVGYLFSKHTQSSMPMKLNSLKLSAYKYPDYGYEERNYRETRRTSSLRNEKKENGTKNTNKREEIKQNKDNKNSNNKEYEHYSSTQEYENENGKRTRKPKRSSAANSTKNSPKRTYTMTNGNINNKDNKDGGKNTNKNITSSNTNNNEDMKVEENKQNKNNKDKDDKERLTKLIGSNNGLKQLKELFLQVGSVTSTRDVSCTCRREKLTKSVDDQAWLDRLVGCTENYMYLMLPKRSERSRLGLLVRDGWRDLLTTHLDPVLMNDINNLLPEYARNHGYVFKNNAVNYNADVEEWCRLRREDLIDVTSDTEVYMRLPDNYEFESQVFNIDVELNNLNESENFKNGLNHDSNNKDLKEYGIFVFYQNDIDGICSMFILEHHKKFRNGMKLTSYPITNESDIYTYIKKSLSIKTAYPSLNADKYLRVILLGINGWNEQILYSIKLYFEQLLPNEIKKLLKIIILTTVRPLSFFNTSQNDEWYFFLQDDADMLHEIQQEELQANKKGVIINGIYKVNSMTTLMEMVVDCVNECDKAIILFANCIGLLSNYEFNNNYNVDLNKQIRSNYDKIQQLQGGPYITSDVDKLLTPLITLSSFEESLKISPYILIYDPNITNDTLSDIRIYCNLKLEEYTSQFTNLHPKKQTDVLKLLKNKLNVNKSQLQLCWIRRTITISSLDILYIILSMLLASFYVGSGTNSNNSTANTEGSSNPNDNNIIITDFLYKILIERVYEESGYDKNILTKLKNYTMQFMKYTYQLIVNCKIKKVNTGYDMMLTTVLHPTYSITQTCHLNFISFLIISIYSKNSSQPNSNHKNLLLFVNNPISNTDKDNRNDKREGGGFVIFGYNSEVSKNTSDLWSLVFKSVAHENNHFVQDCLNPNILHTKLNDVNFVKNQIVNNLKIVLQVRYQANPEDGNIDDVEDELEELI